MSENAGAVAFDRSKGQFLNCIFNNNLATNFSAISVFQESLFLTECFFINNYVADFACVYMNKASGIIRSYEFYKNRCDSFELRTAVICLSDPHEVNIIGCKFSENLKDYDFEFDHSIFISGKSGVAKIRFCTFDASIKDSIISQTNKNFTIFITNCKQDLSMNLYSKSIEEAIVQFSKSFKYNFSENLSMSFCMFAIFGTIILFLIVAGIFSCIGINLF